MGFSLFRNSPDPTQPVDFGEVWFYADMAPYLSDRLLADGHTELAKTVRQVATAFSGNHKVSILAGSLKGYIEFHREAMIRKSQRLR